MYEWGRVCTSSRDRGPPAGAGRWPPGRAAGTMAVVSVRPCCTLKGAPMLGPPPPPLPPGATGLGCCDVTLVMTWEVMEEPSAPSWLTEDPMDDAALGRRRGRAGEGVEEEGEGNGEKASGRMGEGNRAFVIQGAAAPRKGK